MGKRMLALAEVVAIFALSLFLVVLVAFVVSTGLNELITWRSRRIRLLFGMKAWPTDRGEAGKR
jgi:hypothetical protein